MSEVGQELMEPDQDTPAFLQKRRYRITYQCARCGHEWSRVTSKLDGKDPPCPVAACREGAMEEEIMRRAEKLAQMLAEQRAPAQIGNNVQTKAIDETARIVMADHNLTDLKDNIRPGESMAPRLPPAQQAAADGFFSAGAAAGSKQAKMLNRLGQRAISGAFRSTALNPTALIGGKLGEAALHKVGEERVK